MGQLRFNNESGSNPALEFFFSSYAFLPCSCSIVTNISLRLCLTKVGDHLLEFEVLSVSNQVSHPNTCHNICVQECDQSHNTIYQHTASHGS